MPLAGADAFFPFSSLICDYLSWLAALPLQAPTADSLHVPALLVSLYRLVAAAPAILDDAPFPYTSSELHGLVCAADTDGTTALVRLVALRLFAFVENLSEATIEHMCARYIGQPPFVSLPSDMVLRNLRVSLATDPSQVVEDIDAWLLPYDEAERRAAALNATATLQAERNEGQFATLDKHHLSRHTAVFGERAFYSHALTDAPAPSTFKETAHFAFAVRNMADFLVRGLPVLVTGSEACGKTALIYHACAHLVGPGSRAPVVTLQLGDQSGIDAKSLIGSFVSSAKRPGTFEWSEGVLTRAVRLGKWVVLKDVDRASNEVMSVIKPLVEDMDARKAIGTRPSLNLGSRGHITAKRGFALFATRTITKARPDMAFPAPTFLGWRHWSEVQMDRLSAEDILEIVTSKYQSLALAQDGTPAKLIQTWLRLVDLAVSRRATPVSAQDNVSAGTLRTPSLHDLLKWCRRIESLIARGGPAAPQMARAPFSNQALQEEIALEACDIFLGATPPSPSVASAGTRATDASHAYKDALDRYAAMLNLIAAALGVESSALWHAVRERRPEFRVQSFASTQESERMVCVGRAQVPRAKHSSPDVAPASPTFAMTGPAARLMERLAVCVTLNEATLIVGETGTGKTTVVQQLAALVRKPLIALNLSQQTESGDLLGGFKPLDPKMPATELHNAWVGLFQQTFSSRRNARYMQAERKVLQSGRWARLHGIWKDSIGLAMRKLEPKTQQSNGHESHDSDDAQENKPAKKARRMSVGGGKRASPVPESNEGDLSLDNVALRSQWADFAEQIEQFNVQFTGSKRNLVFSFIEGPLIQAIRAGGWVLLDEINLAAPETLECLSTLLQNPESSLVLSERGDLEPVPRHTEFRLFACMNPATDVGKKDLPDSLRSRFTELYAPSPDADQEALVGIVEKYIMQEALGDRAAIMDIAQCFVHIKRLAQDQKLADGANQRPHYSVRTLARALVFAKDTCSAYGLRRALYEGFLMAFTMLLDPPSAETVRSLLMSAVLGKANNVNAIANFVPPAPRSGPHVQIGPFWLEVGPKPLNDAPDYILTPSVQDKLIGLARAALTRRSPVLIQGPTSAGKTSAIEYLAKRTGHVFVRINNHEHTDLQEYLGSYSTDADTGRLVFSEGLLVTAARQGHWIVLDELNLAPTDVLEALNRLLDDNRELVIPETGDVVKPHPHFMLFATQNPPGLYAGRKVLSRAFRNRFLEIHFDDVPQAELQTILAKRCRIAPSYADRIVRVFLELQRRRQSARIFDTKQAFVTLRDLFRWGARQADDHQQLGLNGYMLIAERARRPEDASAVRQVIEETLQVKLDIASLYNVFDQHAMSRMLGEKLAQSLASSIEGTSIVWTSAMRRLVCLVACSLRYQEPVLLVGETGSGKTSVCQILANAFGSQLVTVNCHQNTDAADLLGGQRPLRNRASIREAARSEGLTILNKCGVPLAPASGIDEVEQALSSITVTDENEREEVVAARSRINQSTSLFEWHDGPLVQAMHEGHHMLLDEISLADDSVLERLNSVLEPTRLLVLAERGTSSASQSVEIYAHEQFQIIATMNPGGDYGKKELSPALRNRFTEVWVPQVTARDDMMAIIAAQWSDGSLDGWTAPMVDFVSFFTAALGATATACNIGLRDLISWARFIDTVARTTSSRMKGEKLNLTPEVAFAHGAMMTFVDGLPLHPLVVSKPARQIQALIDEVRQRIYTLACMDSSDVTAINEESRQVVDRPSEFAIGGFGCGKGPLEPLVSPPSAFDLTARTPATNAMRVLRAMQVKDRAIMLEGSPGAGKTSLIVALAHVCQYKLTRINLSDQTELSDLFGADLPVEGGKAGEFGWREAAFLKAMQEGGWVLLDEMNLASQSVLEGLNSCLDHRGTVFVPELGRHFTKHPDFRLFAAQNPQHQGGGRKGLPKSFLNRFTKVFVEELKEEDFLSIMASRFPSFSTDFLQRMVIFNARLQQELHGAYFTKLGQPWEFNLRDLLRWLQLIDAPLGIDLTERRLDCAEYFGTLYTLRFRSERDRFHVADLCREVFGQDPHIEHQPWFVLTPQHLQIGHVLLGRQTKPPRRRAQLVTCNFAQIHLQALQALGEAVRLAWPAIIVGDQASGKTSLIRKLAQSTGHVLQELRLNGGTDATDIIGGFEQVDKCAEIAELLRSIVSVLSEIKQQLLTADNVEWAERFADINYFSVCVECYLEAIDSDPDKPIDLSDVFTMMEKVAASMQQSTLEMGHLKHLMHQLQTKFQGPLVEKGGRFAWKDGPVLRAMRAGEWLLLDEANLCSSSVLDRLNSLLEPGGTLVLSERGVVASSTAGANDAIEVVEPHPNFRIFFALDPKYGELSRAMRNRGVEIFLASCTPKLEASRSANQLSFAAQEASFGSLEAWMPDTDSSAQLDKSMLSSLTSHALTRDDLALISARVPSIRPCFGLNVDHFSMLSKPAHTLKTELLQSNAIESSFLARLGPDLQTNGTLYSADQGNLRHAYGRLLGVYLHAQRQDEVLGAIEPQYAQYDDRELPVLVKSAMVHKGYEVPGLDVRDRSIFPLASGVAHAVKALVCAQAESLSISTELAEYLDVILDCNRFLISEWSQRSFNDSSKAKVAIERMQQAVRDLERINHCADDTALRSIDALLTGASRQVILATGRAMLPIWRAFIPASLSQRETSLLTDILKCVDEVRGGTSSEVVTTAIEVSAALLHQYLLTEAEKVDLLEVAHRTLRNLQSALTEERNQPKALHASDCIVLACLALSIQTLSSPLSTDVTIKDIEVSKIIEVNKQFPLSSAFAIKALQWSSHEATILERGQFDWIQIFPSARVAFGAAEATARDLFRPFLLLSALDCSSVISKIPLEQLDQQMSTVSRMLQLHGYLAWTTRASRAEQCSRKFVAFAKSLVPHICAGIQTEKEMTRERADLLQKLDASTMHGLPSVLGSIRNSQCSSASMRAIAGDLLGLLELIRLAEKQVEGDGGDLSDLGATLLRAAMTILLLYVPSIPLDPLVIENTVAEILDHSIDRLLAERTAILTIERRTTGNQSSQWSRCIDTAIELVRSRKQASQNAGASFTRPTTFSRTKKVHAEMTAFIQQIVSTQRIEQLISKPSEAQLLDLYATVSSVLERIGAMYADVHDIVAPFSASLSMMQLALGMLLQSQARAQASGQSTKLDQIVNALAVQPTSVSSIRLQHQEIPVQIKPQTQIGSMVVPLLLVKLEMFACDIASGRPLANVAEHLQDQYGKLWYLWSLDQEREKKQKEEDASLYRVRKLDIDIKADNEIEEQEFAELFPQYNDIMEDQPNKYSEPTASKASRKSFFAGDDMLRFYQLHQTLFHGEGLFAGASCTKDQFKHRLILVDRILKQSYGIFDEALDHQSTAFRLDMLHDANQYMSDDEEASVSKNFYHDANPMEARKLIAITQRLVARLNELIAAWPEQFVLQHIKQRCEMILQLDVASPVNRLLAALESLLQHTEDWQAFASSKTSLQANRDEVTNLIIEWRRKEVQGWKSFLDREAVQCADSAKDWWMTLYQAATRSQLGDTHNVSEFISLLDKFLRGSSIGQFESRLQLVAATSRYLSLVETPKGSSAGGANQNILANIVSFFQQFQSIVSSTLQAKRNIIERDIADFVKLASWKDTNVHALKTSAAKTHRKLHQCLRKFRVILNEGVDPLIAGSSIPPEPLIVNTDVPISDTAFSKAGAHLTIDLAGRQKWHRAQSTHVPDHLVKLDSTMRVLGRLFHQKIKPMLERSSMSEGLLSLVEAIKERSEGLAKDTPSILTEANEKAVKSLETRKRKAWSELLKELRRIGLFASTVEGLSLPMLADSSFIFGLPGLGPFGNLEILRQAERKHHRLLAMLPVLRATLTSRTRSSDVDISQLQRSLSYVESAFLTATAQRLRINHVSERLDWLDRICLRLSTLSFGNAASSTTELQIFAPSGLYTEALEAWTRVKAGLQEIVERSSAQHQLCPYGSTGSDALQAIVDSVDAATEIEQVLFTMRESALLTGTIVMSASESASLLNASEKYAQIVAALHRGAESYPALRPRCQPLCSWMLEVSKLLMVREETRQGMQDILESSSDVEIGTKADRTISSVLVIVQDLSKLDKSESEDTELEDRVVISENQSLISIERSSRIDEVVALLRDVFLCANSPRYLIDAAEIQAALARLLPSLQTYAKILHSLLRRLSLSYATLLELSETVCHLTTALATRGFCRPRPAEEQSTAQDDAAEGEQLEGGVGLGEGEGAKDVTDTMEDDEQMEELEGQEDKSDERGESKREDNAREMDQNFDGEIGDAEQEEGEDADDNKEEEQDIEDAVGEVDPLDINAVDEKTWADDRKDKDSEQKAEDRDAQQKEGEDASSRQEQDPSAPKAQDTEQNAENAGERGTEAGEGAEGAEGESDDGDGDGDDAKEDNAQSGEEKEVGDEEGDTDPEQNEEGLGRAIDQEAQQGENLDLAEDLKMDEDATSQASHEQDSDMEGADELSVEGQEEPAHEGSLEPDAFPEADVQQEKPAEEDRQDDVDDPEEEDEQAELPREPGDVAVDETKAEESNDSEKEDKDNNRADGEDHAMAAHDDVCLDDPTPDAAADLGDAANDATAQQQESAMASSGRRAEASGSGLADKEDDRNLAQDSLENPAKDADPNAQSGVGKETQKGDDSNAQDRSEEHKQRIRSLGDVLKQFRRDLDAIEESFSEKAEKDGSGPEADEKAAEVQHVREEEEDTKLQALGAAAEDDAKHTLSEVGVQDEDNDSSTRNRREGTGEDDEAQADREALPSHLPEDDTIEQKENSRTRSGMFPHDARSSNAGSDDEELDAREASVAAESNGDMDDNIQEAVEEFSEQENEEERLEMAYRLWKLFSLAVNDHAFALSEQLRLILTPTKATKLSGDFRTGKRLNMRKIIPFIASDYVKDKIWLRRHLPQKREYQVLVCVDDSKSMADSQNRTLAFKSLALVCNALDRLEVGQVGVMKFGRQVELLQGFGGTGADTVGDAQGAHVFANLPFDQRGTNVLGMMQRSFETLVEARQAHSQGSGGQQKLWQLQLIISDGVCQDHNGLRAMLRRANEAHVMVVFIILDSLQPSSMSSSGAAGTGNSDQAARPAKGSNSSILTMSSVEYKPDATGRMQLQMRRYLDTFPFEYFVIVQDVADLPEVLSTTLRQWAQRIAEA